MTSDVTFCEAGARAVWGGSPGKNSEEYGVRYVFSTVVVVDPETNDHKMGNFKVRYILYSIYLYIGYFEQFV